MAVPPPSPAIDGPADDKGVVRSMLRRRRRAHVEALAHEGGLASATEAAATRLLAHVPAGAIVALYHPVGGELDTAPLGRALGARGHRLALPHVADDRTTMRFVAWSPGHVLERGAFSLSQPHGDGAEVAPTIVVTPLVGFDRRGGRIGQGAGYYDRAFAALPGAIRIGYAWSVQEMDAVPLDPWDVPLHAVATELEWIAIREVRP